MRCAVFAATVLIPLASLADIPKRFLPKQLPELRRIEALDQVKLETAIVGVFPEGCPASAALRPYFLRLTREYPYSAHYYELRRPLADDEMPPKLRHVVSYPLVLLFRKGSVIDLKRGALVTSSEEANEANMDDLKHLLARNSLSPESASSMMRSADRGGKVRMRRSYISRRNLSGLDLRGSDFSESIIAGVLLEDADLRDVDLRGAVISHSVLKGARLDGAKIEGAIWLNVVCPDGSSTGTTGSCEGHLNKKRTPKDGAISR